MSNNLFNRCCHFAYSDTAMWLKCVWHSKNAIFTQNFAMSTTYIFTTRSVVKNKPQRKASAENLGTFMPTLLFFFDFY